ncbi:ATP-grasp fold amidoligase family protein [Caballeronia sp. LZ062]|uniref:ATP-grasp fold amidoligase family protein n=1 Tax=unclassified Caballeronia TaxID=2646786 RepID=UPI002858AFFC|nr:MULTISPECIES: ATP-grasp fold amidoligase family protein [unclassified Caballeronia]MDR5857703.1 ATP-grasp fold amidoligase family protein [Caballeronia sp. LZ050]MDR5869253.1 ATP-grasp fold amidoligase family protein [Caballeronia sp. LZ062]
MPFARTLIESAKACLPDELFLSVVHRRRIGRFPNLRHPATFNEHILRRCLSPDPRYVKLSDKLAVRDFVAERIGPEHLIPLIADPPHFTRAVFDSLPSSFVMKANHGSGFVEVVRDKTRTSFEELSKLAQQWLSTDFYRVARERHYREIEPRIFFETLLLDESGVVPADLKFHVFNPRSGKPIIYVLVISDRFGAVPRGDVFDTNWQVQDITFGQYKKSPAPVPRPENLDALLSTAAALARDFDYVRVDLYTLKDKIYFGELTFTPGAGVLPMGPDRIDYEWGRLLDLTHKPASENCRSDGRARAFQQP